MNELIKIKEENGQQLVSARELHEFLEVKTRFSLWISQYVSIENKYGFENDVDFTSVVATTVVNNGAGRELQDYALTIDMSKEISMITGTEKGKEARKYFISCEKKLKENKQQLPGDYISALKALVASEEERQRAIEEKKRLIHDSKTYTATEIAKELGFRSATLFNRDLKERKIQYKVNGTWVLCARYAEEGYQDIKQMELDSGKIVYDRKWTGKGRDWLINEVYKLEEAI